MVQNEAWECAIDFGGSSTKWAVRGVRQEPLQGADHQRLWQSRGELGERLTRLLVDRGRARRVVLLGVSISGDVDPESQVIRRSDRMAELMPDFAPLDLREQLRPAIAAAARDHLRATFQDGGSLSAEQVQRLAGDVVVGVCNDGVAAGIGAVEEAADPAAPAPPTLVLTLGSWPATCVVQREAAGKPLLVYETDFTFAEIGTAAGPRALHHPDVLTGEVLRAMDRERRSRRVGRALSALLGAYWRRFTWQPERLRLMGGHSADLDGDALQAAFNEECGRRDDLGAARAHWEQHGRPRLLPPEAYDVQSRRHLQGAATFARLAHQGAVRVLPTGGY